MPEKIGRRKYLAIAGGAVAAAAIAGAAWHFNQPPAYTLTRIPIPANLSNSALKPIPKL